MQESSLAKIRHADVELELDEPPTREEIKKATMQLKVDKSPGIDGIPAEVYQHIILIINPLTARVIGAPQMILQPVFSIFPCSPQPSGTCRTPGLSIP